MTIHDLTIYGFGMHSNLNLHFEDGINIIYGCNESGKSTIAAFIRAMLYGLPGRGAQNERKKYLPWIPGVKYGGEFSFMQKGIRYRVVALFGESKKEDKITLINDTTGETVPVEATKTVGEVVLEIPPETYDLTVYAAQLSSKPDLDNGNMDYLFDQLVKKSDKMTQTSSDIIVGKRIKTAMDAISSPRNEKGALDILQAQKASIDSTVQKIYGMETDAEQLRGEYHNLKNELKEIKDQHTAKKTDMASITKAVETVSQHNEVKSCVEDINQCDELLSDAAFRAKRIRKPALVIYILLLLAAAICAAAIIFSPYLEKFAFLQNLSFYRKVLENKTMAYGIIGGAVLLFTIVYAFVASLGGGQTKELKEDLFNLEEELSGLLNTEYLPGAKNHSYNRDNINAALEAHTAEYKWAKGILDTEDRKNSIDRDYLSSVEEYTQKIAYTKASADALNKTVNELGDREDLQQQSEELAEQIETYKRRLNGLALAKSVLEDAYQRWQADLGPAFGNEAGKLLEQLTNGRYNDLRVARNFEITLRSGDGAMHNSFNYSGATIDQMYLALRLALVKIISPPESVLPLILDDPFVQYDLQRKQYAYTVIERFAAENHSQIMITTCRKEVFEKSFHIIELQGVSTGDR